MYAERPKHRNRMARSIIFSTVLPMLFLTLFCSFSLPTSAIAQTTTNNTANSNVEIDLGVLEALDEYFQNDNGRTDTGRRSNDGNTTIIIQSPFTPEQEPEITNKTTSKNATLTTPDVLQAPTPSKKPKAPIKKQANKKATLSAKAATSVKTPPKPVIKPVRLASVKAPKQKIFAGNQYVMPAVPPKRVDVVDIKPEEPEEPAPISGAMSVAKNVASQTPVIVNISKVPEVKLGTETTPQTIAQTQTAPATQKPGNVSIMKMDDLIDITETQTTETQSDENNASNKPKNPLLDVTKLKKMPRPPPERKDTILNSVKEEALVTLKYDAGDTSIGRKNAKKIKADVIPMLRNNPAWRVQIQSFASSPEDGNDTDARRTSLSRALSIRAYLIDEGLKSQRIDIRALGSKTDRSPADRVDVIIFDDDK